MTKGQRAGDGPIAVDVEKDKSYYWCHVDSKQPFCDGSHNGQNLHHLLIKQKKLKKCFFVLVNKQDQPMCDGSHNAK